MSLYISRWITFVPALLLALPAASLPAQVPFFTYLESPQERSRSASVRLFDTGSSSPVPLSAESLSSKAGWTNVPEGETDHKFQGDAVLFNDRLAVVLRRGGAGVEVYSRNAKGSTLRAVLAPTASDRDVKLISVTTGEYSSDEGAVEATFQTRGGKTSRMLFALSLGQAFVRTEVRSGVSGLRVDAPCRFVVLPDFFADDIVVDAAEMPVDAAELPSENFLLHMLPDREAIVMSVWDTPRHDARIVLSGNGKSRRIARSEIQYGSGGKIWVAVLAGPGIWHGHEVAREDAGKVLSLDWHVPFSAQWRVDWRRDDHLGDSWEMLTQKPSGDFIKHGWFGQPESFGTPDWMKPDRQRWTTVLGRFQYPCWVDNSGRGYLQPLAKKMRFQGPAVIYPINRLSATPIDTFTIVDIVRATLGVGPCEYILDVEGQQKRSQGIATCTARSKLNDIYNRRLQKQKRAEVEKALVDVLAFVQHIRVRIEDYVDFGHEMVDYLAEQETEHPELAQPLSELETLVRQIDSYVANRKSAIGTPAQAVQLVAEFRTTLVDYEGDDAAEKCQAFGKAITRIGGGQDELVGECRMAVKILRQRAGLIMAVDPPMADICREIRLRTREALRNPTSYEAPRH